VSCAPAGTCTASGNYNDSAGHPQAFVVSQVHGAWGTAKEVPGTAALNTGGSASANSLSCPSAGNCSAGGTYTDSAGHRQVFVTTQVHGTWHTAEQIPGFAALNTGGFAVFHTASMSCASAGNCTAGGQYYTHGNVNNQPYKAFVVSQKNGTWGKAEQVPGLAALDTGRQSQIDRVSCHPAGSCTAGGYYTGRSGNSLAFVVSQKNGTWGTAEEVPGIGALSKGGFAAIDSVSCASAGNCSAGGLYTIIIDRNVSYQAFTVSQNNDTWGKAEQVPGLAALNTGENAILESLSCGSAGNCSAGGIYAHRRLDNSQAFVVTQHNGTWGKAEQVPGTPALNKGHNATIDSVSCASAGNCSAGGSYTDSSGHSEAFVVSQAS
jgi:hypothetical protein